MKSLLIWSSFSGIALVAHSWLGAWSWPGPAELRWALASVTAGAAFSLLAGSLMLLRHSSSQGGLVLRGPYRLSRNPMLLGSLLLYASAGACLNSLWPLALLPGLALVLQRWVVEPEEQQLAQQFAPGYQEYCARVPRWLPLANLR